ncbi:penicillin acylase family protein [Marinactinospora endophytica]
MSNPRPRSRLRRWILGFLAGVAALLLIATGTVVFTVQRSFPDYDGELTLPGLDAPVTVRRDAQGIPHVYAETTDDLFRAQGYVHAQDRFWQMDFNRHVTAGRTAELFGEAQVETDAYLRTMGWRRVAEQEYDLLSEETRRNLDAYAEGVNAYLDGRSPSAVSVEYALLGVIGGDTTIEEWSPVDSLAWLKAMAWDLRGNMEDEIERAGLLASGLERDQIEELYPDYPEEEHTPIVTEGKVDDGAFRPEEGARHEDDDTPVVREAARGAAALGAVGAGLAELPRLLGPASPELGSNSWVVSGEHTESGLPLLANDPHLGAQMPSVWHQGGLHCAPVSQECPYDVVGFGFAGLPGVVIGHNDRVAWGFTNLGPDVTDLYLEKVEGDHYVVDGERLPLETRQETIKVAGGEDVEITVRSTGNGPLLSDVAAGAALQEFGRNAPVDADGEPAREAVESDYAVALRWTALEPGRTADAIFLMNRARDFDDFRAAARSFEVPAQNLVYADVEGTIGYQAPGRVPVRGKGDGRWPAPGWDSAYAWKGEIPFEELPYVRDPGAGYVVTANQAAVGSDYAHLLTSDWDYGYRAQRIDDLLSAAIEAGPVSTQDMLEIQLDNENSGARAVVPHLLEAEVEGAAATARDLLADWDFQQDVDSAAAAFYNATWRHLLPLLFDELPEEYPMDGGSRGFLVVSRLLEDPDSSWWSGSAADGREEILATAMERAAAELTERLGDVPSEWRWGDLHTLTATDQSFGTSGIGPVEWLVNSAPVQSGGGSSTVNATGWNAAEDYAILTVPSMRMVVDLADPDASRWINLTGTSGHAFHPNHEDQLELWATGESTAMVFTADTVEEAARHELVLLP